MFEKIKERKRIIIDYYIVAAILFIATLYLQSFDFSLDHTILTILGLFLLIFPIVIIYTYRYALHIFLFVLAFITGFYSYYVLSIDNHSVLNALYFTFKLYLLDMTETFTADGSYLFEYPILVEIARWSAAAYTISTVFIAMYRFLEMSILLFFAQLFGKHFIVFGWNENSKILVDNLRRQKKRVIVIDNDLTNEEIEELEEMKVVGLSYEDDIFIKSSLLKAHSIVLCHLKDIDNLYRLIDMIQYTNEKHLPAEIIMQLKSNRYKEQALKLIDSNNLKVRFINIYDELAEKVIAHYNDKVNQTKDDEQILIVGFQSIGQHIATKLINSNHEKTLHISALDKDIDIVSNEYLNNKHQKQHVYYNFVSFNAETDDLDQFIRDDEHVFDVIFICLEARYLDLIEGIELSNQFPNTPIFIHLEHDEKTMQHLLTHHEAPLYIIDSLQSVLTYEHIFEN